MKTIKPFLKVAVILFVMYFHLLLITAIGMRINTDGTRNGTSGARIVGDLANNRYSTSNPALFPRHSCAPGNP